MDLAINNLQRLICHKTQTINNQSRYPTFLMEEGLVPLQRMQCVST